jgi:hypothetical protein
VLFEAIQAHARRQLHELAIDPRLLEAIALRARQDLAMRAFAPADHRGEH